MRKFSDAKIKLLILLFILIAASIACNSNIPDVVKLIGEAAGEQCETVDRNKYEMAAKNLGQTPEIPSDPESAVYEVCYERSFLTDSNPYPISARMYEGDNQVENLDAGPDGNSQQEGGGIEGKGESVPAGTYIGVNPTPLGDWKTVQDKYIIEIAEDGIVTGSRIWITRRESVGPTCTVRFENGHTQSFSGYITGTSGFVTVTNDTYNLWDDSDCPEGSYDLKTYEFVCDLSPITISGKKLEIVSKASDGNSLCGSLFQATKP